MPEQVLRADEQPEGEGWEMRLVRWTGARVSMIYVPMKHIWPAKCLWGCEAGVCWAQILVSESFPGCKVEHGM